MAYDYPVIFEGAPNQPGPTYASRAMAIIYASMFDAWNSVHHEYHPFLTYIASPDVSSDAAVASAARFSLSELYPAQSSRFIKAFEEWMEGVPSSKETNEGVELGEKVARAMLKSREKDGALPLFFDPAPGPGKYEPTEIVGMHAVDPTNPDQGCLT